ncbi:hypothetical protein AB670_02986 [Chryseobacterium sp. MOF25P]|uniref:HNH endonuclease domain-containing protein n=1 Tax=unclassified Chryseobacterium TaxID=2593645 RepID=UPI0008060794|nr:MULTISPECIES: HNH endonuclease domain-containing protein [unclassified Chryseobacterium]OBW40664.1 hypothetical protein AB670_02986 [Chryseobacterium sp. MOF25P]OBW43793.1 hypothetical protein AB671_04117 [Chryseobacterium sp. BGARF1]
MLEIKPSLEAIAYHHTNVSLIFDKIIDERIGARLLEVSTRKFLKRYKNILIKGKPELLLKVNQKFDLVVTSQNFENLKICFRDRGYKTQFQENYGKEFLEKLGIDTCVYCNRNYTIQLVENRARAELDHWFPKESYPILALSFYNLIPSCHSCNHIKHSNSPNGGWENALTNINHPYLEDKTATFSFSYFYSSINHPKIIIKSSSDKAKKSIEFSKIDKIYESQSSRELKDLLELRYKYSNNYLDILLNKTFTREFYMSKEEAYRMVFGIEINEEDYHKRPFSKFKKDIIEELLRSKQIPIARI